MIYNYITTNKINGKQYVGMHSTNKKYDCYLGSGNLLKQAIKKYGRENFSKEILCYCETKKEANDNEAIFIQKFNTIIPNGYNLNPAGGLGYYTSFTEEIKQKMKDNHADYKGEKHPLFGKKHTEESKQKNRESKQRFFESEEGIKFRAKISHIRKTTPHPCLGVPSKLKGIPRSAEVRKKIGDAQKGKVITEEAKKKGSESQKIRLADPAKRQVLREASIKQWENPEHRAKYTGENHPMFNKKHSEETRAKMRLAHAKRKIA